MEGGELKPIIFWEGFPACGLLTKKVLIEYPDTVLMATRPKVAFEGLEDMLGHKIVWLEDPNDIWEMRDQYADRNFILHTGWRYPGWRKYDQLQKKSVGAATVVVVDNSYRGDLRQHMGAAYFRLYLKRFFDAAFVPGQQGVKLMQFLGMPEDRIFTGNYGASEDIYFPTSLITERPKSFFYVGQLIERKGVDVMLEAFKQYRSKGGTWDLTIAGSGPLEDLCKDLDGITFLGFTQPDKVAALLNQSRVLLVPSRHDNWGTVVAEGAACGMHIVSTTATAASHDIITDRKNGIVLDDLTVENLLQAMHHYEHLTDEALSEGSQHSLTVAAGYTSQAYLDAFRDMATTLL